MRYLIPAGAAVLTLAAMIWQADAPEPRLEEAKTPVLGALPGFEYEEGAPGETEIATLPADTRILRGAYVAPNGRRFIVTAVVGGRNKASIHRPELCLPAQGFRMASPHDLECRGRDWRVLRLDRGAESSVFAYTFYNQAGMATSSHLTRIFTDVWDRSVLGRIDRWVMVTVLAGRCDDQSLLSFLAGLEEVLK